MLSRRNEFFRDGREQIGDGDVTFGLFRDAGEFPVRDQQSLLIFVLLKEAETEVVVFLKSLSYKFFKLWIRSTMKELS